MYDRNRVPRNDLDRIRLDITELSDKVDGMTKPWGASKKTKMMIAALWLLILSLTIVVSGSGLIAASEAEVWVYRALRFVSAVLLAWGLM